MAKGQKKQKLTPETIGKLEQAFAIDATVGEACFYADINPDTYYRWINENKELNEKFTRLREKPILTARQTIAKSLHEPEHAKWYLERKKKLEFSTRNELTGADGKAIEVKSITGMKIIKDNGASIQNKE